jgi:hypothetical protein
VQGVAGWFSPTSAFVTIGFVDAMTTRVPGVHWCASVVSVG